MGVIQKLFIALGLTINGCCDAAPTVRKQTAWGSISVDGAIQMSKGIVDLPLEAAITPVRKERVSRSVEHDADIKRSGAPIASALEAAGTPMRKQKDSIGAIRSSNDLVGSKLKAATAAVRKRRELKGPDVESFLVAPLVRKQTASWTVAANGAIQISSDQNKQSALQRQDQNFQDHMQQLLREGKHQKSGNDEVVRAEPEKERVESMEELNGEMENALHAKLEKEHVEIDKEMDAEDAALHKRVGETDSVGGAHVRESTEAIRSAEAMSAGSLAQRAFEKGMISTNMLKVMNNATILSEAALSVGLPWNASISEKHIQMLASHVASLLEHRAQPSGGPDVQQEVKNYGQEARNIRENLGGSDMFSTLETIADVVDAPGVSAAAEATTSMLGTWVASGTLPTSDQLMSLTFSFVNAAIGMSNPLLGFVSGIAFTFLSSIFGGSSDNALQEAVTKLYKQIMQETKLMISMELIRTEVAGRVADLNAINEEIAWVPGMLGGVSNLENTLSSPALSKDQQQMLFIFDMMLQHDIAKTSYRIRAKKFGESEEKDASSAWFAAMVPIALSVQMLQVNVIYEISTFDVSFQDATKDRLQDILSEGDNNFHDWFGDNRQAALQGAKTEMEKKLKWLATNRRRRRGGNRICGELGGCMVADDVNACNTMGCKAGIEAGVCYYPHQFGHLPPCSPEKMNNFYINTLYPEMTKWIQMGLTIASTFAREKCVPKDAWRTHPFYSQYSIENCRLYTKNGCGLTCPAKGKVGCTADAFCKWQPFATTQYILDATGLCVPDQAPNFLCGFGKVDVLNNYTCAGFPSGHPALKMSDVEAQARCSAEQNCDGYTRWYNGHSLDGHVRFHQGVTGVRVNGQTKCYKKKKVT